MLEKIPVDSRPSGLRRKDEMGAFRGRIPNHCLRCSLNLGPHLSCEIFHAAQHLI